MFKAKSPFFVNVLLKIAVKDVIAEPIYQDGCDNECGPGNKNRLKTQNNFTQATSSQSGHIKNLPRRFKICVYPRLH